MVESVVIENQLEICLYTGVGGDRVGADQLWEFGWSLTERRRLTVQE